MYQQSEIAGDLRILTSNSPIERESKFWMSGLNEELIEERLSDSNSTREICVALDGGGIKGAAEIMALRELSLRLSSTSPSITSLFKSFDWIGGTSVGAVIAAFSAPRHHENEDVKSIQLPTLHLNVTGVGIFPKMLRKLFQLKNETVQPIFVLDDCLLKPSLPDYDIYVGTIFLPLLFMFFSQILLAFLPKRVILFCFLPYMFPRKARARVIWLYNLCLKHRLTAREEARRRIAFFVKWRKERKGEKDEDDDDLCFCHLSVSYTYLRAWQTHKCEQCPATYCKLCWKEPTEKCYACQVEHQEAAIYPT
ncbi:unnamed protein product, partial [Mesorhabditis belari]|uniref:PNPLA domain-containing protein n=1 Tax=Mesorhabditis belari TaxID=2138241 RepID=A0AAF3F7P9_9BILA